MGAPEQRERDAGKDIRRGSAAGADRLARAPYERFGAVASEPGAVALTLQLISKSPP